MYGEYIKERLGHEIVESNSGFASYRFTDAETVYLMDLYIAPEFRKMGVARDLGDRIAAIAKQRGCTKMLGSVVPSAFGSAESMKVLLAYGMTPISSSNDFVLFQKEIL